MSDLTLDEQTLIAMGEFISIADLIAQIQSRLPEVKRVTLENGKINFWIELNGKSPFRFGLALNNSPLHYEIEGKHVILNFNPERIAAIGDIDGYVFVLRDAIQKGGGLAT